METQEHQTPYRQWFFTAIVCLVVLFLLNLYQGCESRKELAAKDSLYESMNDSLIVYKTKDSLNGARIAAIQSQKPKDFINASSKDTTIIKLQKLVKKYESAIKKQGSVSVINTEAEIAVTVPTISKDSISDSKGIKSPVYEANFALKNKYEKDPLKKDIIWVWGKTISNKDSTTVNLKYKDELTLVIGVEKTGFLKLGKGKPFADVTSSNPYSEFKDFRVYQTQLPPPKKIGIGPGLYCGISNGFQPQVFIGVGVQYNFIRL